MLYLKKARQATIRTPHNRLYSQVQLCTPPMWDSTNAHALIFDSIPIQMSKGYGFQHSTSDHFVFVCHSSAGMIVLIVHVDDVIIYESGSIGTTDLK